jgi:hypothetical protein
MFYLGTESAMTLRYYDVLESLLHSLDDWRGSSLLTKEDVLDGVRERVLLLMTHVITTPLIGTAYAYPGDIQTLDDWLTGSGGGGDAAASSARV